MLHPDRRFGHRGAVQPDARTKGPWPRIGAGWYDRTWPNLLIEDGGPTLPGRIALTRRRSQRRARQLTSQATRALRGTWCSGRRSVPSRLRRIGARSGGISPSTWSAPSARASAWRSSCRCCRRSRVAADSIPSVWRRSPPLRSSPTSWARSPAASGPRSARQMAAIRVIGAASLLPLFVLPTPPVMVAAGIVFWVSLSLSSPFQLRLWGAMYPARLRGRIVGSLGMGRSAAMAIASLAGGVIADRIGGPAVIALGGLIGAACAIAYTGLRAPAAVRTAALLRTRLPAVHPRTARPGADHAGAGLLRRRAGGGDPALRPRLRRPARPQPRRRRPDRRPRRRLDDRLVPAVG